MAAFYRKKKTFNIPVKITSTAHVKTYFDALVDVVSFPRAMQYIKKSSEKAPVMHKLQSEARILESSRLASTVEAAVACAHFSCLGLGPHIIFRRAFTRTTCSSRTKMVFTEKKYYNLQIREDFKIRLL